MTAHPNVTMIRDLFTAFAEGDLATIERTVPDDAVWHFPGRSGRLAGVHRGRDAILAFLLNVVALTEGSFDLELIDVLADDRWGVALFRGSGRRRGRTLDNPTCLRMRLENQQVVEVHEFVWDLYHVDDFWS